VTEVQGKGTRGKGRVSVATSSEKEDEVTNSQNTRGGSGVGRGRGFGKGKYCDHMLLMRCWTNCHSCVVIDVKSISVSRRCQQSM
jgi:hypothetical protein